MTEHRSPRDEFKTEVSKIANRFLENYFGEERPIELGAGLKLSTLRVPGSMNAGA